MKKLFSILFTLVALSLINTTEAQIKIPAASPLSKVVQTVGLTKVEIEYSRPSVKGRKIFGDLVPYGKLWRTGANDATKITFAKDVKLAGKELKAGAYALLTTPHAASWDFHFFNHTTNDPYSYEKATPTLTVSVKPEKTGMNFESLLINIDKLNADGATLSVVWANTKTNIDISVDTDTEAMASIKRTLAGPTDWDYYDAGIYLASRGRDLENALMYIRKINKIESPYFWIVMEESEVLAQLGRYKEAIEVAEKSIALAIEDDKEGNKAYVKMNKENIAKWSKM